MLVCLKLCQRILTKSSSLFVFFFLLAVLLGCFLLPYIANHIWFSASSTLLLIPFKSFFILISVSFISDWFFLFFNFIYLFLDRGGGMEKERERSINVWLPIMHLYWGPDLQPRCVPWLGIEPVTLWFTGWHSIHWATPVRAWLLLFYGFHALFYAAEVLTKFTEHPYNQCFELWF